MTEQPKNLLHGVTLKAILEFLIAEFGFPKLGDKIHINCFIDKPSLNSSLVFLRKTPWAREKVEKLYIQTIKKQQKQVLK